MPTSPYAHLYPLIEYLDRTRPSSLLDIGLGNGKIGFIARDYLDVMTGKEGKFKREDWETKIDGIEIFPEYIQDHQRAIYDDIFIGNAFDVIDTLGTYDMIVLGDVLEHFEKNQAHQLLDKCIAHCNRNLVICIPLGESWKQEAIYGNPYEQHRSFWSIQEFEPFITAWSIFQNPAGPYGIFLVEKEDYLTHKIKVLNTLTENKWESPDFGLRKRYKLNKTDISETDLRKLSKYVANEGHLNLFLDVDFTEHYRLMAHLSSLFDDSIIFDIGTNQGYSALALSYNDSNRVISYDIEELKELNFADELNTIEYLVGDVLQDHRLLDAALIVLDTNHDGGFENEVYRFLKKNRYKGLLFLDDIHLNQPMVEFWNAIKETKEDITDLGHWSGSGLVDFQS
ncbi:hypothetical protein D1AOALGA4SA_1990 [Olavius algarvensis Delta 1 endosymbiont]|nr:hypothetical protein D1AOALGA4SA_1990 [Olavius algarvensis Delta 1 endosymbiont]